MSHIESITFNKFRIFDSEFEMELKPITFLVGPNSSGKSSVLKSFLLLKSNYSSNLQVLDFTGDKHNLGTFSNTINKKFKENDNELIQFNLKTKLRFDSFFGGSLNKEPITTKRSVFNVLRENLSAEPSTIILSLYYKKIERSGKLAKLEMKVSGDDKSFLMLNIANDLSESHNMFIDGNAIKKEKNIDRLFFDYINRNVKTKQNKNEKTNKLYSVPSTSSSQSGSKQIFYDEPILVFSKLFKLFLDDYGHSEDELHNYFLRYPLKQILQDFSLILENTEYIEAVRANTKRLYTNDSQGTSFNELILDYNSREVPEKSIAFINKWLKEFDIANEIIFDNVEGVATTVYLKTDEDSIALADLGYGITQFLPILLKIGLEQPIPKTNKKTPQSQIVKKLILLEEPETNLHPKLQSLLADFIVDAIKTFEVRFIIETHSEYIIRRLQILTVDKVIKNDESLIYYFNSEKDSSKGNQKITKIEILPNGSLTKDFGEGFFDEATRMKFELLRKKSDK